MKRLSLHLLGTLSVDLDGQVVTGFRSNKVRALLAYLAIESERSHSRHSLAALFWPESPDQAASRNLRLTLHRLRRTLNEATAGAGDLAFHLAGNRVQINRDVLTLDVATFLDGLAAVNAHGHIQTDLCLDCLDQLELAVTLYQGELMAGFELGDAPQFEEWLLVERERLKRLCLWVVSSLAAAYEQRQELDKALNFATRELEIDSYREDGYRRVMRLLALDNRRNEAIGCYMTCRRVLAEELGIEPDEQTTALYNRIRAGDIAQPQTKPTRLINFPAQFTPLVGRKAELKTIRERLLAPNCRLLTLTGLGGVGKTRLAIEAARQVAAEPGGAGKRFADGIYFAALASVDSPDFLPATLATDLKLTPRQGTSVAEQVVDFLRHKKMLLVLDNFEQLREDALWLLSILEAAPGIEMLVTSRLPLDLRAEERLVVNGLGYPSTDTTAENALAYPAVRLFVQAARRVQQDFELLPPDVPAVTRICELVDGRPLALEIAAGWLRIYDCSDIAREIERSYEFLATTLRDVPARHRSIRTVFDHTWEMLSASQRRTLANLAVFRGPFSLEAALGVADTSIVDMAALLDASLVQRSANGWYEVHSLLRQYAEHQISDPSSRDEAARRAGRRHSEYFLTFLAAKESEFLGPDPHLAVTQIQRRIDDSRLAWQRASSQGWLLALEQSLEGLALFYDLSGLFGEGAQMLAWTADRLLELDEDATPKTSAAGLMSRLFAWQAHFVNRNGQAHEAIELLFTALALAEQSGIPGNQAVVQSLLGEILPHRGEFDLAQQYQEQAIAFFRSAADERHLAAALTRLGVTRWRRGNYESALICFEEALTWQQALQNRLGTARILWSMGGVAFEQRRYAEALRYAEESRAIYEKIGDQWGMATLAGNLALLSNVQGDYETALAYNQMDLAYDIETGNRHGEAVALGNRGSILLDSGQLDEAMDCFRRAMSIQEKLGNIWEVARHRASIADIWVWRKEPVQAMAELRRALPVLREHGARFYLVAPLLEEANLLVDQGALTLAEARAREIDQLTNELGIDDQRLLYRILLARLDHSSGDTQDALKQLRDLADQATDPGGRAIALYWLWRVGRAETDRREAESVYQDLWERFPKYEYAARLRELQGPMPYMPRP